VDVCIARRIDFIKIDVEGSALLVFKGARRILEKDRPTILVEINPENLLRTSGISAVEFGLYVEKSDYCLYEIIFDGTCGRQIRVSELSSIQTLANVAMFPAERSEAAAAL
jgi:hypothetical protein